MKTYIWTIPTRLFHWLLALSFAIVYALGDEDSLQNLHFAFGAFLGILVLFRLLYGFIGPKYSHFRDFPVGVGNQIEFAKTFFANTKYYAGHNPAASVVMLCIFIIGLTCSISGFLIYASENLAFNIGLGEDFLEEAHEVLANSFLVLVMFHLLGIAMDTVFHGKIGTLQSIFSGYKNIEAENAQLNSFHKIFAIAWFIVPFIFFYIADGFKVNESKTENPLYKSEENNSHEDEDNDSEEEEDDD